MQFKLKQYVEIKRIEHDIKSNAEIARRCGWYPTSLSRRLLNPGQMRLQDLEIIANAMGCDLKIEFVDKK